MKVSKLLQLIRDNAGAEQKNAIRAEESDSGAHIYVFGVIDPWWGASAEAVIAALAGFRGKDVHVHVNSPGGDVFEGRAIAAALVAHDAQIICHIDGLVASAATYIPRAANQVLMTEGGRYMIHESWTIGYGNKGELRKTADLLEGIDADIASDYVKQTGATLEQVNAWMEAETWFSADQALEHKFIDAITPNSKRESARDQANWNLSAYRNAPKSTESAPPKADPAAVAAQLQANRMRLQLLEI